MTSSLQQRNQALARRTVALTETAIAKLQAESEPVTLANVAAATRDLDPAGRGISPTTIVRNPQALAIFRRHSPAYQQKLNQKPRLASDRSFSTDVDPYPALDRMALIRLIEALQVEIVQLEARLAALQNERDTAYRLRDEALHQNARQLAVLTKLMDQPQPTTE